MPTAYFTFSRFVRCVCVLLYSRVVFDVRVCFQALRRAGFQISEVALSQLIRRLDVDGDGVIEYHEFVRFSQAHSEHSSTVDADSFAVDNVAIDRVSQELRAFVQQVTGRTDARFARYVRP